MHFGFALELSNVDLLNIDLLGKHLDLLDTDIPSQCFACLHNIFKTSWRHVLKTCLQDMSSRHLQDVFNVTIFRLSRRLQDVFQDVFKTSSRRLQDVFARRLQDFLEDIYVEDTLKTSWRPTNVCWDFFSLQFPLSVILDGFLDAGVIFLDGVTWPNSIES